MVLLVRPLPLFRCISHFIFFTKSLFFHQKPRDSIRWQLFLLSSFSIFIICIMIISAFGLCSLLDCIQIVVHRCCCCCFFFYANRDYIVAVTDLWFCCTIIHNRIGRSNCIQKYDHFWHFQRRKKHSLEISWCKSARVPLNFHRFAHIASTHTHSHSNSKYQFFWALSIRALSIIKRKLFPLYLLYAAVVARAHALSFIYIIWVFYVPTNRLCARAAVCAPIS